MINRMAVLILLIGVVIALVPLSPVLDMVAGILALSDDQVVFVIFASLQVFLLAFTIFRRLRWGEACPKERRRVAVTYVATYVAFFCVLGIALVLTISLGHFRPFPPTFISCFFWLAWWLGAEVAVAYWLGQQTKLRPGMSPKGRQRSGTGRRHRS